MNEKIRSLLNELEQFGKSNDSVMKEKEKRMRNITPETGEFLSFMVTATKSKNILEIGTSNGYSTIWLADSVSANTGQITTLEYSVEKANLAKDNFEKSQMTNWIDLKVVDAGDYIKEIPDESIDMIFLDSDRKEYVEWWGDLQRILISSGTIIVDNIVSHFSELQDFIELVSKNEGYKTIQLTLGSGLLLITKNE